MQPIYNRIYPTLKEIKMRYVLVFLFVCVLPYCAYAAQYAVVDGTGLVVDVVQVEDGVTYTPQTGTTLQRTDVVGKGWIYSNGVFNPPPTPPAG